MKGQIFKIHSDFYYANTTHGIFECKIREILKKQRETIFVGDFVELEQENFSSMQAFISKILPRNNYITKPKVANIDQIIIVSAIKNTDSHLPDFEQLNRYLCFCEYHKISPILCFNKKDLNDDDNVFKKIKNIYGSLGYKTLFTSALNKEGITELENILKDKVTVLCGASGVGKSSIANAINSDLNLKTKPVSEKTGRGTHTTRHCEIIELELDNGNKAKIVDTPGFSHLKFDFLMPSDISSLFPEIEKYQGKCKFADCLHEHEIDCSVINNLDKIDKSRYESYLKFVSEAKEYKTKVTYSGTKTESNTKTVHNKTFAKISNKKRQSSRKKENQNTNKGHYNE